MSFTAAELAEMAAADAEIEANFVLTDDEAAVSAALDRDAKLAGMDTAARRKAERNRRYYEAHKAERLDYQRRYYEANKAECLDYRRRYREAKKAAAKCSSCDYRRALATLADAQVTGADCPRFGTDECQQVDRRKPNGR